MSTQLTYEPLSNEMAAKANLFLLNEDVWKTRVKDAVRSLADVSSRTAADGKMIKPAGYLSVDPMNMSVFGMVFDEDPGEGFIPMPSSERSKVLPANHSASVETLLKKAHIVWPDVNTRKGEQVMRKMRELSSVYEDRPLLAMNDLGIKSMVVSGNKLVISRAARAPGNENQIVLVAAPEAVSPTAKVKVVQSVNPMPAAPSISLVQTDVKRRGFTH